MTGASIQYVLLIVCWISALVTLVIFLESWLALARQSHLATSRSTGTHGALSVLVPLRGNAETVRRCFRSILDQSYPFIELLIIYDQDDATHAGLAEEFEALRSHVLVRKIPVAFAIDDETTRIRALNHAQSNVRGTWMLVLDSDVTLNRYAVESALEFCGTEGIKAVALSAGIECRSVWQKLTAPSLEWLLRMISIVDRNREQFSRLPLSSPFVLLHGHSYAVINKMNRLPGILNESGWSIWSYSVEGPKTFHGDGSGWIAREATVSSMVSRLVAGPLGLGRLTGFVFGNVGIWTVSVIGILFGIFSGQDGFSSVGIFYFSAFSYSLMATSYYCYSRRLGAAAWFAPFWFLSHSMALVMALCELRRSVPNRPGMLSGKDSEPSRKLLTERH